MDGGAEMALASTPGAPQAAQREIIRRGSLQVQVESISESEAKAAAWVKKTGGYIEGTDSSELNSVRASINMTLRIPVKEFDDGLAEFASYGTLVSKSISSEDITTQLVDMRARLKVLREQETVLLGFLRQSKTLKDSLAVNSELTRVRQEIESMDAVRRSQEELASLSTISLTLVSTARFTERPDSSKWAGDAWTGSVESLVAFGRALGTVVIHLLVYVPIWGPVAFGIWFFTRRKKSAPKSPPAKPPVQ